MHDTIDGTIIQLEGGHSTVVRLPIHELTHDLTAAKQEGVDYVFLQSPSHGDNGYVVNPDKVVALVRTSVRT